LLLIDGVSNRIDVAAESRAPVHAPVSSKPAK